jgi:flagellar biosynthetic protein FliO
LKDNSALNMVWIILVLVVVFYLTWLVTRFVAARSKGRSAGRFMRVVDRLAISNDKAMLLVKIGSEYCVVGVTGHEINLIKTLTPEEAEAFEGAAKPASSGEWAPQGTAGVVWKGMQSFSDRLGFAMKRPQARKTKPPVDTQIQTDEQSVLDMMNERVRLRKDSKWR